MSLTIPSAGSAPGQVANLRTDVSGAAAVARAAGGLGDQIANIGNAIEDDALTRQRHKIQTDLTRAFGQLRLDVSQIGDPDAADAAYLKRVSELKTRYGKDSDLGIHQKNTAFTDRILEELDANTSLAIGRQTLAARQSEHEANWIAYQNTALQASADADANMRDTLIGNGNAQIDDLLARGVIDAATAQRRKLELARDIDNNRARQAVAENPQAFLDGEDQFPALDGDTKTAYRMQAKANIQKMEKAAADDAERAAKEAQKVTGDRLHEIRDISGTGKKSADLGFLNTPEAKAHPDYPQTMAALELSREQPDLLKQTPAQIDALIAGEKASPATKKYQTERLGFLEKVKADHEAGFSRDPFAYAKQIGLPIGQLPEFDAANPTAFAAALTARQSEAEQLKSAGYIGANVPLFDAGERDHLAKLMRPDVPAADRLAFVQSMTAAFGDKAADTINAIKPDPAAAWTAQLLNMGLPSPVARDILDGQTRLAQNTAIGVTNDRAVTYFEDVTGGMFRDQPQLKKNLIATAQALFAADHATKLDDSAEKDAFAQAIQRALGAMPDETGALSVGGMQELQTPGQSWGQDSYQTVLPPFVSPTALQAALGQVTDDLAHKHVLADPNAINQKRKPDDIQIIPPRLDRLTSASVSGLAPDFGDPTSEEYDPADKWSEMQIEPYWPTGKPSPEYLVYSFDAYDRKVYLKDTGGQIFRLNISTLIKSGETK